jgi:hypothetical protein
MSIDPDIIPRPAGRRRAGNSLYLALARLDKPLIGSGAGRPGKAGTRFVEYVHTLEKVLDISRHGRCYGASLLQADAPNLTVPSLATQKTREFLVYGLL